MDVVKRILKYLKEKIENELSAKKNKEAHEMVTYTNGQLAKWS